MDFSFRITGEIDGNEHDADSHERMQSAVSAAVGAMLARGVRTHSVTLNNQPVYVAVDAVEVKTEDPDEWIAQVDARAMATIESGGRDLRIADRHPNCLGAECAKGPSDCWTAGRCLAEDSKTSGES